MQGNPAKALRIAVSMCATLALSVHAIITNAAEPSPAAGKEDKEFVTEAVNLLSDCAGYWEFGARLQDKEKPASAEAVRGLSRGARIAAAYMLSVEASAKGGKQRPAGDFFDYVDARLELNLNKMLAFMEQQDSSQLKAELEKCKSIAEMQKEIIQHFRDAQIGR